MVTGCTRSKGVNVASVIIERTITYRIERENVGELSTPEWGDIVHATPDLIINEMREAYRDRTLSVTSVRTRAFSEVDLGKNA